jgi:hypothetical protein
MPDRYTTLKPDVETLDGIAVDRPTAVMPTTAQQWRRSLTDAALGAAMVGDESARRHVASHATAVGSKLGRDLRPAR